MKLVGLSPRLRAHVLGTGFRLMLHVISTWFHKVLHERTTEVPGVALHPKPKTFNPHSLNPKAYTLIP